MKVHEHAFPNSYMETNLVLILDAGSNACSKHESTVVERLKSMNNY